MLVGTVLDFAGSFQFNGDAVLFRNLDGLSRFRFIDDDLEFGCEVILLVLILTSIVVLVDWIDLRANNFAISVDLRHLLVHEVDGHDLLVFAGQECDPLFLGFVVLVFFGIVRVL